MRICGVGTVFGDPALRDRSHARVLVEQLVDEAGRNGADLALVFWPPDSGFHAPDGFDVMPMMEVELKVKEPSRYGAPMMLVRDGDNRDLAAVVAMGRVQAGQFRFHVDRDLDLVKYAITRKRLLAGLAPTGTRQLRFVIAEEGITAAADVVISIVGRAWTIEECGDRDHSGARVGAILQAPIAREPAERRTLTSQWASPFLVTEMVPLSGI